LSVATIADHEKDIFDLGQVFGKKIMKDRDCIDFLQWSLPKLGMRWPGFRKVRRQVCRRIARRMSDLGLDGIGAYRDLLGGQRAEWQVLDRMCFITISRFYRDRQVYGLLAETVFPALVEQARAKGEETVRCWSAGCCAGEEPYTLALVWQYQVLPRVTENIRLQIVGTDADPAMLGRAREGRYGSGSLKELPKEWISCAFSRDNETFHLTEQIRRQVDFVCHDLREEPPFARQFHLICCRNLAFTYFDEPSQSDVLGKLCKKLCSGGALVIGCHEELPAHDLSLTPWQPHAKVFRHVASVL
jgi:chemotaxis protein methyltransferase CheR